MTKVWAFSNNKGGVLKTSLTISVAGLLSLEGKRVLIIDADSQGNVAISFGKNPDNFRDTIYDVLMGTVPWKNTLVNVYNNIDIIPSNTDLQYLEFDVLKKPDQYPDPFRLLKNNLKGIEKKYDYVLIDCPPSLGGLMFGNVANLRDVELIVPYQPERYSIRSLQKLVEFVADFKRDFNSSLQIKGIIFTMVDKRTAIHSIIIQETRKYAIENVLKTYDTVIPRSIRGATGIMTDNLPVTLIEEENQLKKAYKDLFVELNEK
ncbi:ParA family protein [Campylobacter jejuni]|uniref:ParA family protein n=1 Tax=Campylobacter jejuni TaxID=197 RepID=UPI003B9F0DE9